MPNYFTVHHISRKDLARIFGKIKVSAERSYKNIPCWEWTGSKTDGYANMRWCGKVSRVHRILYAWVFGPIPAKGSKMEIDHLCRNTACVNPSHTELVTSQVNSLRSNNLAARYAVRTHCNNGHEFSEANTYIAPNGSRRCRTCKNENTRRRRRENGDSERVRARLAARQYRAARRNSPEWRERQREAKRAAYARYRLNPEWVAKEHERLRAIYRKQKQSN